MSEESGGTAAETSSASRRTQKVYDRNGATIRAVLGVGAVFTLVSPYLLQMIVFLIAERGSVPENFLLMALVAVPQAALRSIISATLFVLLFWFAKDFFLERWVLYGTAWWILSGLGIACTAAVGSTGLAGSALQTVLTLVACMSSAYLTKVIYSRTVE